MLRFTSKLNVRRCFANQRLAQFCSVENTKFTVQRKIPTNLSEERDKFARLSTYYRNSERHNMFQRNSKFVYQFDDETRNLTEWQFLNAEENVKWDESTRCYTNHKLIRAFENMLNYCLENDIPLADTQFDHFIDDFCQRLEQFTLNEVICALQIFAKYPLNTKLIKQRNGVELFYAFDQACTRLSNDLLASQLLFVSSIWLSIPSSKQTWFARLIPRVFSRYMRSMSAPELAQAFLYINCMSQQIEDIRSFENVFEKLIDDMTAEEFATILWTFIRLDTKIQKPELRDKYFRYLEKQDLNRLSEAELSKVLIITSRIITMRVIQSEIWLKIMKNLRASLDEKSMKTCILISNLGFSNRAFDDEINSHLYNRCLTNTQELQNLTMEDFEYLSRILGMSNYVDDNETIKKVGILLLNELKNRLDAVAHKGIFGHLVTIVRNLNMINIYDLELLENLLSPTYIQCIYDKNKHLDLQMYEIDGYCRINLKDIYKGNLLRDVQLEKLRFLVNWVPDRVKHYRKMDEYSYSIEDAANKLFKHSHFAHAIPHRKQADLFVCLDKTTLKPIDISDRFPPLYKGKIIDAKSLTKDDPNLLIFTLIAGNITEYLIEDKTKCRNIPIGYLLQKIEQLKMLGYHPIAIPARFKKLENKQNVIETFIVDEVNKVLQAKGINSTIKTTNK